MESSVSFHLSWNVGVHTCIGFAFNPRFSPLMRIPLMLSVCLKYCARGSMYSTNSYGESGRPCLNLGSMVILFKKSVYLFYLELMIYYQKKKKKKKNFEVMTSYGKRKAH